MNHKNQFHPKRSLMRFIDLPIDTKQLSGRREKISKNKETAEILVTEVGEDSDAKYRKVFKKKHLGEQCPYEMMCCSQVT